MATLTPRPRGSITDLDLAWAAGFFDSSGSIVFPKMQKRGRPRRYSFLYVQLSARDLRCAREFVRMFEGHVFAQGQPKPTVRWRASCRVAEKFLRTVLPFLRRKKDAARLALLQRETVVLGHRRLTKEMLRRRRVIETAAMELGRSRGSAPARSADR